MPAAAYPVPVALTIAGSDSGGGAGIQADLKTFAALGVYGTSVIAALTAQNTRGVQAIHVAPAAFVQQQIASVLSDFDVRAIKIGMLGDRHMVEAVAEALERWLPRSDRSAPPVVLDPVMIATTGATLLTDDAIEALIAHLFPRADLVTPNLHEAARLLGTASPAASIRQMQDQAEALLQLGARSVLIKGGHGAGDGAGNGGGHGAHQMATDVLVGQGAATAFAAPRVATANSHGTGCTLSSAIAAVLAQGRPMPEAVELGKGFIAAAIASADRLGIAHDRGIGCEVKGHGPVDHFAGGDWWQTYRAGLEQNTGVTRIELSR